MGKYLDKNGLARVWSKVKSTLGGYMRTDGANSISFTGGNGNTAGWRLVIEETLTGWSIRDIVLAIASRHTGIGTLSIGFHITNADATTWTSDIRFYGSQASVGADSWKAFYNKSTKKFRLYWHYSDYNGTSVNVLSRKGFNVPTNGTWYETLPTDNGTELTIQINNADDAKYVHGDGSRDVSVLARQNDVLTSNYTGGTGFSSWAFGVTRDTKKGYIGVLKPNVNILNVSSHSPLMAFGTGDTHALIGVDYYTARMVIGAGNADKLNWYKELMFTDSSLAYSNLTGKPAIISALEGDKTYCKSVSTGINAINFGFQDNTGSSGVSRLQTINFKTLNGTSLIGSGNISIETGWKEIASGTNLDTLTTPGIYHRSTGVDVTGTPPSYSSSRAFTLLVQEATGNYVIQVMLQGRTNTTTYLFLRYLSSSQKTWKKMNIVDLMEDDV